MHRASIRWMFVLSDVSVCQRRTRDAIQCRADVQDQATRDVVWPAKGAHVPTNWVCARTLPCSRKVCGWGNARFVDDGTSPNLPQRHYRRQETTTQRRRFRCHWQPRLMIACAELLHMGIHKPLSHWPVPVCVSVMRGCVLLSALPSPIWMLARVPAFGINAGIGWTQN